MKHGFYQFFGKTLVKLFSSLCVGMKSSSCRELKEVERMRDHKLSKGGLVYDIQSDQAAATR